MEYLKMNYSNIEETKIGHVPVLIIEPKEKTDKI